MESIGIISDCSGVLISSLYSKAGTVALKVRAALQSEMARDKWLNPVVQLTDLSRISETKFLCKYHTGEVLCRTGQVTFMCPPRKCGVAWGDREIKNIIGPGSFQFFSFQKKTEKKKNKKGEKKRNKPLPAEKRPSFSHYCGRLAVV